LNAPDTTGSPSGEPPVPTCFRHPGRETYLSCVRCGRPTCPDCLRDAPVGQQCVECVRAANRAAPAARTVFGGKMTSGPVVTWVLIAINVVLYLVELIDRNIVFNLEMISGRFADPAHPGHFIGVGGGQYYRLITSAFLHDPTWPVHILFNMWALYVVGPPLEQALGRLRFTVVYLASALGGSVLFYLAAPPSEPSVGASGAIFGLFGAWFVVAKRLRLDPRGIIVLIVLNLVISFAIPRIAWQAHVGGLVTGAALTAAFAYAPRNQRLLVQACATGAILALLVIATVIRTNQFGA
jgi:membrane associated rhomboid family serine protease